MDAIPVSPHLVDRVVALGIARDRIPPIAARVTTSEFFAFWRALEEEAKPRDFGLRLGAQAIDQGYSVAGGAALHAGDLAEALRIIARFKRLTCPEDIVVDVRDGEASVRFHWLLAENDVPRLLVESSFASLTALTRRAAEVNPIRIELARTRTDRADAILLRDWFACPVVFEAPVDRIVFAERDLAKPFATANAEAFARVLPGLEAELTQRTRARTRPMSHDVRLALARQLSTGARPSVEEIARRLRVSPRTLQRRLGEERTSYQAQLDEVRRTVARRLLARTRLDPTEVAFFLGFEEPNSFARAFRGWQGTTPQRFRAGA